MHRFAIKSLLALALCMTSCGPASETMPPSANTSQSETLPVVTETTTAVPLTGIIAATNTVLIPIQTQVISPQPLPSPTGNEGAESQVVWRGRMPSSFVSALLADWPPDRSSATILQNSMTVFGMDMWVGVVAAYIYVDQGDYRLRALLLVPSNGFDGQPSVPFLAKTDLALTQVAGHESFGDLDQITRTLEREYQQVAVLHFLQITVLTEAAQDKDEFRAERQRLGIELPEDTTIAQKIVLSQWQGARALSQASFSTSEVIAEYMAGLDEACWDDVRVGRFDVPLLKVCVGPDPYNCATYSSVQLSIDALALPEVPPRGTTPTPRLGASQLPAVKTAVNAEIMTLVARETVPARGLVRSDDRSDGSAAVFRFLHLLNAGQYNEAAALYGGSYKELWAMSCCGVDPRDHAAIWRDVCERMVLRCLEPYGVEWATSSNNESLEYYAYFTEEDGSVMGAPPNGTPFSFSVISSDGQFLVIGLPPGGK